MRWTGALRDDERMALWESEQELLTPPAAKSGVSGWFDGKLSALGKRVPEAVKNQATQAVAAALDSMFSGSGWLISQQTVYTRMERVLGQSIHGPEQIRQIPVRALDHLADDWTRNLTTGLTIEGAAAGASGFIGLAADIPILYCSLFKVIQEIAILYGFPVGPAEERLHIVQVLDVGHCRSSVSRPGLVEQGFAMQELIREGAGLEELEALQQSLSGGVQVQALARNLRLARQLALDLLERKLLQGLVIVGSAIGAAANYQLARDVGWSARHLYRRRFLLEVGSNRLGT